MAPVEYISSRNFQMGCSLFDFANLKHPMTMLLLFQKRNIIWGFSQTRKIISLLFPSIKKKWLCTSKIDECLYYEGGRLLDLEII